MMTPPLQSQSLFLFRSDVAAEAARVSAEGQNAARCAAAAAAATIEAEEAKQELQRARRDIVRLTALSGDV